MRNNIIKKSIDNLVPQYKCTDILIRINDVRYICQDGLLYEESKYITDIEATRINDGFIEFTSTKSAIDFKTKK